MNPNFFIFLFFFIIVSCAIPRYKKQPDGVQMVHYHMGYEYRGVNLWEWFFKYKNPRYGEGYGVLVKDPAAIYGKNKKIFATRVKARRTYIKPPSEEQWEKLINPPVDSTKLANADVNKEKIEKKKPEKKNKKTEDTESAPVEEMVLDTTVKK